MNTAKQKHKTFGVHFPRLLSDVFMMIFINIKCQWDFIKEKKPYLNFEVVMTYTRATGNPCSKEQRYLMWCIQLRQE